LFNQFFFFDGNGKKAIGVDPPTLPISIENAVEIALGLNFLKRNEICVC
jgi:hypothetical protein